MIAVKMDPALITEMMTIGNTIPEKLVTKGIQPGMRLVGIEFELTDSTGMIWFYFTYADSLQLDYLTAEWSSPEIAKAKQEAKS